MNEERRIYPEWDATKQYKGGEKVILNGIIVFASEGVGIYPTSPAPIFSSTLMSDEAVRGLFARLREPIEPRWRVQNSKGGQWATVVPYIDARAVQNRLDEVLLPENWANTYEAESGTASISIRINNEWISKSDIGTDSNVEKEKGKASDAFKRAAVLWGIGRDLYHIGTKSIVWNEEKKCPVTPKGESLNTATKLTLYMNGMNTSLGLLAQFWAENKELQADEKFKNLVIELKNFVK